MEDFTSLRQYLALEEERHSAAPRSASDRVLLEEAAELGRALVQKNEELQQENEALRAQRRTSVMSSMSDVSQDCIGLDEAAPAPVARRRHPSSTSAQGTEGQAPATSRLSTRRQSDVSLLAKEYDHDMEGLLEENGKLKEESSKLERSNRELNAMVQELSAHKSGLSGDESGLSDEAALMRRQSSRRSNGRKVSFSTSLDDEEGPDVMDELDTARAQTWSLQQELEAARRESSKLRHEVEALTSECREQQGELEARGDEVESLHTQLMEVSDLIQQQRWLSGGGAAEALLHMQQSPGGRGRAFRRGEKGAASLARDLQTAFAAAAGSDCTGEDSAAEASGAMGSPSSPSFQFFGGAGAAAASRQTQRRLSEESRELEEQRQQLSELQAQLASSETAEKEACEAAARHREAAKRARQDGEREAQELRQRLARLEAGSAAAGAGKAAVAAQPLSSQRERELLKKNEKLRRSLQAETKNREVIEAELLRTLMMMRKLDCELF